MAEQTADKVVKFTDATHFDVTKDYTLDELIKAIGGPNAKMYPADTFWAMNQVTSKLKELFDAANLPNAKLGTINVADDRAIEISKTITDDVTTWRAKFPTCFITDVTGGYRIQLDSTKPIDPDGDNSWDLSAIAGVGGYICWNKTQKAVVPRKFTDKFDIDDLIIGFSWWEGTCSWLGHATSVFDGVVYNVSYEPDLATYYPTNPELISLDTTDTAWTLHLSNGFVATGRRNINLKAQDVDATPIMDGGGYIYCDRNGNVSVGTVKQGAPGLTSTIGMCWWDGTLRMQTVSSYGQIRQGKIIGDAGASIKFGVTAATHNIFMGITGTAVQVQADNALYDVDMSGKGFDLSRIAATGGVVALDVTTNKITGLSSINRVSSKYVVLGYVSLNTATISTDLPYSFGGVPINTDNPFAGMSILCTGDSVTEGYSGVEKPMFATPYPYWIQQSLKCSVTNAGRSGKFLSKDTDGSLMPVLKANDLTKYQVITIAYGINDWNDSLVLSDVTAKLQTCLDYIWAQNPSAYIIGITPSPVWTHAGDAFDMDTPNAAGNSQRDFIQALVDVYEKNSVPVFDLRKAPVVTKAGWHVQSIDGIHPTEATHKLYGYRVAEFIKANA